MRKWPKVTEHTHCMYLENHKKKTLNKRCFCDVTCTTYPWEWQVVWTFGSMSKQKYTNSDPQIKQDNAVFESSNAIRFQIFSGQMHVLLQRLAVNGIRVSRIMGILWQVSVVTSQGSSIWEQKQKTGGSGLLLLVLLLASSWVQIAFPPL